MTRFILITSICLVCVSLALLVIVLFPVVSPEIASQIDPNYFYEIHGKVKIDKEVYTPCETVNLNFLRTSRVTAMGELHKTLFLNRDGANLIVQTEVVNEVVIEKGGNIEVNVPYQLPCDLPDGNYFVARILFWDDHSYQYETPIFEVKTND